MNFKTQVVYEAGPNSRFNKLSSRLQVGKTVFISGFFDLNENELPFIEAKEIDLLDDFNNNSSQARPTSINPQSPFSRANKFKGNKDIAQSPTKIKQNISDNNNDRLQNIIIKSEKDLVVAPASSTSSVVNDQLISEKPKKGNKRKDLADLSIQRLNKTMKNTKLKVKTRSQMQTEEGDAEEN